MFSTVRPKITQKIICTALVPFEEKDGTLTQPTKTAEQLENELNDFYADGFQFQCYDQTQSLMFLIKYEMPVAEFASPFEFITGKKDTQTPDPLTRMTNLMERFLDNIENEGGVRLPKHLRKDQQEIDELNKLYPEAQDRLEDRGENGSSTTES